MDDSSDGRITVNIAKRKLGGVGFLTNKRSICPYLAVSHVVKGGVAHETGLIQAGDVILEVNGKSLESVPYHKALEILDKVPTGEVMVIKIRAKAGFHAYLETAFDDKGTVKTVRKTRASSPLKTTPTNMNGEPLNCTSSRCLGSLMLPYGGDAPPKRPYGVPREPEEVIVQAKDFLQQYYGAMKLEDSPAHQQRFAEVMKEIEKNGTYDLTEKELIYGCRMAWRNASRCIGRIQWNKLQVFDARHMNTPSEMYEAIVKHIKYGTNKGNLRSTITGLSSKEAWPQRLPRLEYAVDSLRWLQTS
ncbi:hypothetical protein OS493_004193 [Desmophyllum pertusum]|uniref:nitric-oxide synthase (NADPH) n=1 Tax=Desmophyllum pertusum TaxID=174260 RepID=A0A9X0D5H0_9CNID|nr:hypothetical protein OS493_004193 [Desmophyllum pertusum]